MSGRLERIERFERFEARVLAAIDALEAVIEDPELGSYEPRRTALMEALEWLEIEATCGDCIEGRCHWGGETSRRSIEAAKAGREYTDPTYGQCGCARHEVSVEARHRRLRLRGGAS